MNTMPMPQIARYRNALLAAFAIAGLPVCASAADFIKANNTTALNSAGSYTGNSGIPGTNDVIVVNGALAADRSAQIGGNLSVSGFRVESTATNILTVTGTGTGASSSTLRIGTGGVEVAADKFLTLSSAINQGTQALIKSGNGTLTISGNSASGNNGLFAGVTLNAGTLILTNQNSLGGTSGASSTIIAAGGTRVNSSASATIASVMATGNISMAATATTVRFDALTLGANTLTVDSNAGNVLQFRNNSSTNGGTFNVASSELQFIGGTLSGNFTKSGSGTMTFTTSGLSSGTAITVSGGTLAIGANERFANAAKLTMTGGSFSVGTFTETLGVLDVDGTASLSLGTGGKFIFAASNGETWDGTLSISGSFVSGSSIKFGSAATGLNATQLGKISIAGFENIGLTGDGFLTASVIPEPSSFAALAGLGALGLVGLRRRRRA